MPSSAGQTRPGCSLEAGPAARSVPGPWANGSANSASGIRLVESRSTALFQLATELPAAVLARTLGIDITVTVAVKWQRAAAGDRGAYAAEPSRRNSSWALRIHATA
jgi:hypothetical protein